MKKILIMVFVFMLVMAGLILPVTEAFPVEGPARATTDHFTNSVVLIMGKCETVQTPVLWLFGFKVILNREIIIQAAGGADEKLTTLILPSKIGFYFGQDTMVVQLQGAKGLFFRGEKSFLFQNTPQRIFALCKATDIWVTYDI